MRSNEIGAGVANTVRDAVVADAISNACTTADFESALQKPGDMSENLFELANKQVVGLKVAGGFVQVVQDRGATNHSGGVVWETAFFLVRYLEKHVLPGRVGSSEKLNVVELGAGCGLLGLSLSRLGCRVLLTEQPIALNNLKANVKAHKAAGASRSLRSASLTWGDAADLEKASLRGPFDLVVGSDVVFATRFVEPLLDSVCALLAAKSSDRDEAADVPECWFCVQRRDHDAHQLLLDLAPSRLRVNEVSFEGLEGFEAAEELECVLLRFRLRKRARASAAQCAGQKDE